MKITVSRDCDEKTEKFGMPMDEYFEYRLEVGMRIDAFSVENYLELQRVYLALKVMKSRVLAADYSSYQIKDYCIRKLNLTAEESETVLQSLKDINFVNDEKYAYEKAEYWHSTGKSKSDIRNKLRKAGICQEYIHMACQNLNEDVERNNALKLAKQIASRIKGQSETMLRQTTIQRLIQKGYSMEVAYQIGEILEFDNEKEDLMISFQKAQRLYGQFSEPKRSEKIRLYCMRKGFTYAQIEELLEGDSDD